MCKPIQLSQERRNPVAESSGGSTKANHGSYGSTKTNHALFEYWKHASMKKKKCDCLNQGYEAIAKKQNDSFFKERWKTRKS